MTQSLFINFNTNMVIRCKTQKNSSKDLMLVHQKDKTLLKIMCIMIRLTVENFKSFKCTHPLILAVHQYLFIVGI